MAGIHPFLYIFTCDGSVVKISRFNRGGTVPLMLMVSMTAIMIVVTSPRAIVVMAIVII